MITPAATEAGNTLAALLSRARGGETDIPLGQYGADGPTIAAALAAMGADDEDVDDILSRGVW